MEIPSKYIPESPILNITHLIGEDTLQGIVKGHTEASSFDLYQNGEYLKYGLIIFPSTKSENSNGITGNQTINIGESILSIYHASIISDTSKPVGVDKMMVPIKVIK